MLLKYLKQAFKRTEKQVDELTPTDKVILEYMETKKSIDLQVKKARSLERTLARNVNKDGVLQGKKYVYKQSHYEVDLAPTKEDLVKAGAWDYVSNKGLVRKQVKTKRDYRSL